MLPNMLACTILISPLVSATMLTINSTAFPNVAFNSPPTVSPTMSASSSVAKLSKAARGIIAKKFMTKMAVGLHFKTPAVIPRGTKIRRTFT